MWWKIVLLTLYLAVLFVLSRILEAVAYYEGGGYIASKLLDPMSLSVRKLKAILDQRGVSYTGVVESSELKDLVKTSGEVSNGEMERATYDSLTDEATVVVEDANTCTNFTCGMHFYEEVEDTKDSVWVIQVQHYRHRLLMQHADWKAFIKKVARFGVRTGIFDCSLDQRLCDKKNWHNTKLVLAMPQGYQVKDHVIIRTYTGSSRPHKILNWVNHNLASRITEIRDYDDLETNWLHFEKRPRYEKVRIVLFSHMQVPPMFFSVLSVKFTGRVKFGTVNVNTDEGRDILARLNISGAPAYAVLTPEKQRSFGLGSGDFLNYHSMALLLRTLHPEVNDMFLLSLIIVNMACCLEFFIARGNILKRFGLVLWDIVKWNFLLILLWLPVLGVFQLPYMDYVFGQILSTLRRVSMTGFACYVRDDWLWYSSGGWAFLVSTFFAFSVSAGLFHYLRSAPETVEASHSNTNFWSSQWETYMSSLLQPSLQDGISRSNPGHTNYGVDVALLIERLAVPNLWLRPMISSQYVHSLPVWKYTGPCVESDVGSDTESIRLESDGEDGGAGSVDGAGSQFGPRPLMFICEKCRALQNINPAAATKTEQELEAERIESESACATFLMDGDYKCICGQAGGAGGQDHGGGGGAAGREHGEEMASRPRNGLFQERCRATTSPAKVCGGDINASGGEAKNPEIAQLCEPMPPGMIPTLDCSICLESYKYSVVLCGLPCGHTFHQQCIMGWLNRDNHCCPICRWPAYKAKPCNIHQHTD